jgi:hypothetical protein
MKISMKRTGGFAGLTENFGPINTEQLDHAKASKIDQIVKSIGFFGLPEMVSGDIIGADMYHLEITIMDGDRHHTVAFDSDDSPKTAPLCKLFDTLVQLMNQ